MQVKLESLESKQSSENKKIYIFKPFFDMMEQKSTPQPMFLSSHCNVVLDYTCNSSINQLDSNETGKC